MARATQHHLSLATVLLTHEGAAGEADARVHAVGRVYDMLHAHLTPLLGKAGVELLLVRSAKVVQGEFAFLTEASILDGADQLRDRLRQPAPALAIESATDLFATFIGLLMTFIGERLTNQILRNAWPALVGLPSGEKTS
jgi:hypothetical protein